jgi:uncharacterized protein involved in exopolysaccharide biosynthesis
MTADAGSLAEALVALHSRKGTLASVVVGAGTLAFGGTFLMAPQYEARVALLPPQQQQQGLATALASLSGLGALAGGVGNLRTPADQFVGLMQTVSVADRLIEGFDLGKVYDEELKVDIRKELARRSRFSVGKRDGLIEVFVRDADPRRAASLANRYVEELRLISSRLAVTEAQQRRQFFEEQLVQARRELTDAEQALTSSGVDAGTLRAEPRAVVESYARVRTEIGTAEVRLRALTEALTPTSAEVLQQRARLEALRLQLAALERAPKAHNDGDYVKRLREYKYRETLFEVYARQFELARADEAKEGALIQVVDPATPPEKKVWPQRGIFTAFMAAAALLLTSVIIVARARRSR